MHDDRLANLLGALALTAADRIGNGASAAAPHGGAHPAALVHLLAHPGGSIEELRRVLADLPAGSGAGCQPPGGRGADRAPRREGRPHADPCGSPHAGREGRARRAGRASPVGERRARRAGRRGARAAAPAAREARRRAGGRPPRARSPSAECATATPAATAANARSSTRPGGRRHEDRAGRSLLLASAGIAMVGISFGMARYGYGLLLPDIRAAYGLSSGELGLIGAGSYVVYLVGDGGRGRHREAGARGSSCCSAASARPPACCWPGSRTRRCCSWPGC